MKKVNIIILIIAFLFISTYSLSFWNYHLPFYLKGFDSYQHLGSIKVSESLISKNYSYDSEFFPGLYKDDYHLGLNIFLVYLLKTLANIDNLQILFIEGIVYFIFFLTSFYYFLKKLNFNDNKIVLVILIFLLFSTGTLKLIGRFNSFIDLLIGSHYPATLGLSLIFLLLALNIDLEKFSFRIFLLNLLLFTLLFSSHILSGFIYLFLFFILAFSNSLRIKKIKYFYIIIFGGYLMVLLFLLQWPYYNWLTFLINSKPIQNEELNLIPITLYDLFNLFGLIIIGGLCFFKNIKKNLFMLLWIFSFFLILVSYLTPLRVSSYWRFLPFIKIPLILGFTIFVINLKNKGMKIFLIFAIVIFSFLSISFNLVDLSKQDNNFENILSLDKILPNNSKLYGEPYILYGLQGLGNKQSYLAAQGHAGNINSQNINEKRLKIWEEDCINLDNKLIEEFDYLVGDKCKNQFLLYAQLEKINGARDVTIYKINKVK